MCVCAVRETNIAKAQTLSSRAQYLILFIHSVVAMPQMMAFFSFGFSLYLQFCFVDMCIALLHVYV